MFAGIIKVLRYFCFSLFFPSLTSTDYTDACISMDLVLSFDIYNPLVLVFARGLKFCSSLYDKPTTALQEASQGEDDL